MSNYVQILPRFRSRMTAFTQLLAVLWWSLGIPYVNSAYQPGAGYVAANPASYVPVWDGSPDEPPEGADTSDIDMDGLPTWLEIHLGTQPGDPDSDDDGALDGRELQEMQTDPLDADSNDNGVNDYTEFSLKHTDADGDGLLAWDEQQTWQTSDQSTDTDGDGWGDAYEAQTSGTSPANADTDGDGLTDWDDYLATSESSGDYDGDGLTNVQEASPWYTVGNEAFSRHTQIRVADTDGDGLVDGYEVATSRNGETKSASNPLVVSSDGITPDAQNNTFLFSSDRPVQPALAITGPGSLSNAQAGVGYSSSAFTTVNAHGSCSFSISAGNLPPGLSLYSDSLAGTPSAGVYAFTVQVTDSESRTATAEYTLVVEAPALSIASSSSLPDVQAGSAFNWSFAATGGAGGYIWSAPNGLSAELTLSSDGQLTGTFSSPTNVSFVIRVTDSNGSFVDQPATLLVTAIPPPPALVITSAATLSDVLEGSSYSWGFSATGGDGTYTWSLPNNGQPAGLSLSADGQLSGTLTATPNTYYFTVQVTDGNGTTTNQSVSLNVTLPPPPQMVLSGQETLEASIWSPFAQSFAASGSQAACAWSLSGAIPDGVSISSEGVVSGMLDGTLTTYSFVVNVTDGYSSASQPVTLNACDRDADGDGVSASLEHEIALESGYRVVQLSVVFRLKYRPQTILITALPLLMTTTPHRLTLRRKVPTPSPSPYSWFQMRWTMITRLMVSLMMRRGTGLTGFSLAATLRSRRSRSALELGKRLAPRFQFQRKRRWMLPRSF